MENNTLSGPDGQPALVATLPEPQGVSAHSCDGQAQGVAAVEIPNPIRWYYAPTADAEVWHRGGDTREDAVAKGIAEYDGGEFYIAECKSMLPSFAIFDADDICQRLSEDEDAWWEDGWTGEPLSPAMRELERRLEATFKQWFAEFATLDGACLDEIRQERIAAQVGTRPEGEDANAASFTSDAVAKPCAQGEAS